MRSSDWSSDVVSSDLVAKFGRIDAVVNNAGILRDTIWHKMSYEDWKSVIEVNLTGVFNVSKAATPWFREQQSGSFIHFTSTSGLIGNIGQANYSAATLGVVALSQSIALDMARVGVRSNCIAPFAWSRMTSLIPVTTPPEQERVKRTQEMSADKIAQRGRAYCRARVCPSVYYSGVAVYLKKK